MLGVLEVWYGKDGGAVEMVLGGGRVLIPSRHRGRFNEEECCEQGDFWYSQSDHVSLEEFPMVLRRLCHFWCCHRDGVRMSLIRTCQELVERVRVAWKPLSLIRTCEELVVILQCSESNSFMRFQLPMNSAPLGSFHVAMKLGWWLQFRADGVKSRLLKRRPLRLSPYLETQHFPLELESC
jgi:hypothetical protein